jgi:hypothetical protein
MMRKVFASLAAFAVAAFLGVSLRADAMTVKGEVIDVMCHMKDASNVGASHADCALSCAKKGAVMAIMTSDGAIYTITGDYAADNNKKLLDFVAKDVEASGTVTEMDGKKTIEVTSMKAAM